MKKPDHLNDIRRGKRRDNSPNAIRVKMERLERRALLSAIHVGAEFRANIYTSGFQADPAIAMEADGDFIVTWYSYGQDGDGRGVYARMYDAAGAPKGDEFLVNTHTTGYQTSPSVAVDADGDFVIVWQSEYQDGAGWGIFGQRFNSAGTPQGAEFRVNTYTTSDQQLPTVAMDADGDFVVAWESLGQESGSGIYAQRYNSVGAAQGAEFRVNTTTSQNQFAPTIAASPGGAFVIAWSGNGDGDGRGVFIQRYDAFGVQQGTETLVNTYTTDLQYYPSLAMSAAGEFVVAWESLEQDGSGWGVYAQRFDETGTKQGSEFRVNTATSEFQHNASVAMDEDGNFVVTWTSADDTTYGIYAQRYNAAGTAQGGEFRVNTYTPNVQQYPAVASEPDGDFIVAWESFGQDGSGFGVFAQRFAVAVEITSSDFHFATAPHQLRFAFNTDVSASLGTDDLVVQNLTTSQTLPASDFTLTYDTNTNIATFTYTGPGGGPAGALADGNYRATLLASGISAPGGFTLRDDHLFEFFFLRGDANHDGRVNLSDFNILAANFGQSPRDFTQGDFNYDGLVNLADFNILAGRFGQALFSPSSTSSSPSIFSNRKSEDDRKNRVTDLLE